MITFNSIITFISLCVIYFVYKRFIRETYQDSKKFKIYALRDKLCLAAMSGQIDQNTPEYNFLVEMINATVKIYEKDFSLTWFFAVFLHPQLRNLDRFKSLDQSIRLNPILREIYHEMFLEIKYFFKKNLWLFEVFVGFLVHTNITQRRFTKNRERIRKYKREIMEPALYHA